MKKYIMMFFFLLLTTFTSFPQTEDTDSSIPALESFHEIIYPIWHTAYPEKDYAALKSYVPEINKKADIIYSVKLPGILREKQEKWNNGIVELKASVEAYNKAAVGEDNAALLLAAENLHSKYENLVRAIRPVLKEMDAFHKVLYVIYHTYLPDKNYEQIALLTDDLLSKAEAITTAKLPKRVQSKSEVIKTASENLVLSVKELKEKSKDEVEFAAAVEKMHSNYQSLEALF